MASCVEHGEWAPMYFACPKCFKDGDVSQPLGRDISPDKQVPSSYGSAAVTPDPLRTVPLETPRTDSVEAHAESEWIHGHEEDGFRRVLKHARDLERELEEALIHAGKETGRAEAALSATLPIEAARRVAGLQRAADARFLYQQAKLTEEYGECCPTVEWLADLISKNTLVDGSQYVQKQT